MYLARLCNTLWMCQCRPELARFKAASGNVDNVQRELLLATLQRNQASDYGRRHRFDRIATIDDFRQQVPIVTYDEIAPFIDRIAAGENGVLTKEPVKLFEPTSGSTGARRLIPYTATLQAEFQRAISAWIADLLAHCPAACRGRAYWSLSPAFGEPQRTSGGLRIGFADDTEYLGLAQRMIARWLLALPRSAMREAGSNWQYRTLLHLLATPDLALISIWSPTFLTALLRSLGEHSLQSLTRDLRGVATARRVREVLNILARSLPLPEVTGQLWPRLALISCWTEGAAANYVDEMRRLFPSVVLQSKGLIATECLVSFPLAASGGSVAAIRSHFFEFATGTSESTKLAHELAVGEEYRVIATTGGGFYRYDTGDKVHVTGYFRDCPTIRFVGRDATSDLVGEKLGESFVQSAIQQLFQGHERPSFVTLVPEMNLRRYWLLCQFPQAVSPAERDAISEKLHQLLAANPYYAHAVQAGQLQPTRVVVVTHSLPILWEHYERTCISRGMRVGDIKPRALDVTVDWSKYLNIATE